MIVQSLLRRAQHRFAVAAAEVGDTERWQIAELGFACVSGSGRHAESILTHVRDFVESSRPDLPLLSEFMDFAQPGDV